MTTVTERVQPADEVSDLLAAFTCGQRATIEAETSHAAKRLVMDSLAVGIGALSHPAAQAARRYGSLFPADGGCRLWGGSVHVSPETAALVNGVLMRCYDYNDLYMGRCNGGHPSDIVPGIIAVAEWAGATGADILFALSLGYEVILNLFDTVSVGRGGWDYTNLTAIGATCAVSRLLGLDEAQVREALAITVIPHAASDEIESHDLNSRGDLTMWKRFNCGDAVRQSVYAALLASSGVEGAVRPFVGEFGFLKKVNVVEDPIPGLREIFGSKQPLHRVGQTIFKRWPVGSRGQSAIQAALAARAQVEDVRTIKEVRVLADEAAYNHLVRIRTNPWQPTSRETADHSLPYIVAAAVLDGRIDTDSFDPERVREPGIQAFLRDRMRVESVGDSSGGGQFGFPTRVEIETTDGRSVAGEAAPPPGHPRKPFSDAEFETKLQENAEGVIGSERTARLIEMIWSLDRVANAREITAEIVALDPDAIDA